MEVTIDLLPFMVEALGCNRIIREPMDALYQSDKFRFYELARNHELYNHPIVKEGGLLQEEYSKKALGILLAADDDEEVFSSLLQLIKTGWKEVYSFVVNCSSLSVRSLMNYIVRKHGDVSDLPTDYVNSCLVVALALSNFFGKKVEEEKDLALGLELLASRWEFYSFPSSRISLDGASSEDLTEIVSLLDSLGPVRDFVSYLDLHKEIGEIPAFLFDFEGVSSYSIFDDISISRQDLEELVLCYLVARDYIGRSSSFELCFCFMFYIRYLIKAYKQVKEHYFANNKETMFLDFKKLEAEKEELSRQLEVTKQLLKNSNETVDSLNRDIKRLSEKVMDLEAGRAELNSLREFVFSLDRKDSYVPVDGPVDLSSVNGVILGGHSRWQSKMKSLLPNFSFIPPDSLNFDQNVVRNADFVFVFVNFLNHAIYYRAMSAVTSARVHFLRQSNEELVLEEIKKVVKG